MKESFNNVKIKFEKIKPLLEKNDLKDHKFLTNKLVKLKSFLIEMDDLWAKDTISVPTWSTSALKQYILPVLSEFFFIQEVIVFHHIQYDHTKAPLEVILTYFKHINEIITLDMDAYSDYLLYKEGSLSFNQITAKYTYYKKRYKSLHFVHSFNHLPKSILIIAVGHTILRLFQYKNRLMPLLKSRLAIIQPLEWLGSKQELAALIYKLYDLELIDIKKANRQVAAYQFASLFGLGSFNAPRLFYNYQHSSHSIIDLDAILSCYPSKD